MLVLLSLLCLLLVGQTQALQIENDDFEILDDEDVDEPVVAPKNNEYDEDEFETAKWVPPPNSPKETKPQPKLQPAVKHNGDFWSLLTTYWMECAYISFFLCYAVNFYFGQRQNENVVKDWGVSFQKLFTQNFAKVGGEAFITKQSQSLYKTSASGRINCIGLEATIDLQARNDLVSVLYGLFTTPGKDTLTIDIAMEPTMQTIVFAILNRKIERETIQKDEFKDIKTFAKKRNVEHFRNFGEDLVVYSDSVELVEQLLPEPFAQILSENAKYIEMIHFTDQSLISPSFKKTLRFVFSLPNVGEMASIQTLMESVFSYIDLVATFKLSAVAEKKAIKVRQDYAKEATKLTKEELVEEREKKLEEKRRKQKEAFDKLSYEEQQKELSRRKKKEEKRRMKGGKMKHKMLATKLRSSHRRVVYRYSQPAFTLPEITKATQQFSQKEYQKALPLLERSIQICDQIFGPTAALTLPLKEMVGEANVKLGKYTLAERTLQQLLGAYKTNKDWDAFVRLTHNWSLLYQHCGEFSKAVEIIEQLERTLNETPPIEAPSLAGYRVQNLTTLGFIMHAVGDLEKGKAYFLQAQQLAKDLPDTHPAKGRMHQICTDVPALPLYFPSQYDLLPASSFDEAINHCNEAVKLLKQVKDEDQTDGTKLLLSRTYDCLMEAHLSKKLFVDAEEFGKKSLEITNAICDRDSSLVEWTLHLMCRAMIGEKKYFFAEGLLRRLDSMLMTKEEKEGEAIRLYQIQVDTLKVYGDVMQNFNRQTELVQLQSRLERYTKGKEIKSNLLLHATFDPLIWNRWKSEEENKQS